jgi:Ca-activated chloride channel family protein
MQGDKLQAAKEATRSFVLRLEPADEVVVIAFDEAQVTLQPPGRASEVADALSAAIDRVEVESGTALYDAVCDAIVVTQSLAAEHDEAGEKRLYGIVVLSDGQDTSSRRSRDEMFNCLPSGETVEGVKVFTIAYGSDADKALLEEIATRTNGKAFSGDPDTIERVYTAISAEQ